MHAHERHLGLHLLEILPSTGFITPVYSITTFKSLWKLIRRTLTLKWIRTLTYIFPWDSGRFGGGSIPFCSGSSSESRFRPSVIEVGGNELGLGWDEDDTQWAPDWPCCDWCTCCCCGITAIRPAPVRVGGNNNCEFASSRKPQYA